MPYDVGKVAAYRRLPAASWNRGDQMWSFRPTPAACHTVANMADMVCCDGVRDMAAQWEMSHTVEPFEYDTITEPWGHQNKAVWFTGNKYAAYFDMGMGTGKTKAAIDVIDHKGLKKVLILCPKSVISVWPKQFEEHGPRLCLPLTMSGGTKTKAKKCAEFVKDHPDESLAIVVNYESARTGDLATWIKEQEWDGVILDEAHRTKTHNSAISKFCFELSHKASFRLCLSGTPLPANPLDIFAQFRFLDAGIFGTSWSRFRDKYAETNPYFKSQIVGFRNEVDLKKKMAYLMHSCRSEDVLDLPDVIDTEIPVVLDSKTKKIYKDFHEHMIAEVNGEEVTALNALSKLLKLQQVTGGFCIDSDVTSHISTEKVDVLRDLLADMPETDKSVVFTRFKYDIRQIRARCGREVYELSGDKNELEEWKEAPEGAVLATQIQAGSMGISMVEAATCFFYSVGYSLGDYEQARARLHRPGQERNVNFYHLVAEASIDTTVYKALKSKKDVVESVLEELRNAN